MIQESHQKANVESFDNLHYAYISININTNYALYIVVSTSSDPITSYRIYTFVAWRLICLWQSICV